MSAREAWTYRAFRRNLIVRKHKMLWRSLPQHGTGKFGQVEKAIPVEVLSYAPLSQAR